MKGGREREVGREGGREGEGGRGKGGREEEGGGKEEGGREEVKGEQPKSKQGSTTNLKISFSMENEKELLRWDSNPCMTHTAQVGLKPTHDTHCSGGTQTHA